jgi:hypothetical protein
MGHSIKMQVMTIPFSRVFGSLLALSTLTLLSACSNAQIRQSYPIPKFQTVAIVNKGVDGELKTRFGAASEESYVEAGAATGAVLAGAGAALACGPFVYLCAMAVVSFAGAGAVGGGLAGAAADSLQDLQYDQLFSLDSQFAGILHQRTINLEVENSLMNRIPPMRIRDIPAATALLQFRLYDVRFAKASSGKYALSLKTVMLFKWDRDQRRPTSTSRIYEHTSSALPMEHWVRDEGKTLNQAFDDCIEGLTRKMAEDIQFR